MEKPKLIYIIQSLAVGGAEAALLSAIPMLNKEFDFQLVCLKKYHEKLVMQLTQEEQNTIKVFSGVSAYIRAYRYILKSNPDIILSSLWKGSLLGILVKLSNKHIKYIQFIHNSTFFHFIDKIVLTKAIKSADVVFCDSLSSKNFISQFISKQTPTKIISFLRFSSPVEFIPKQKIRLHALYVGRFHKQKRIDRLLILVSELKKAGLSFQVDLYGRDDGTQPEIINLIKQLKLEENISLKGEISLCEVKEVLYQYDFYFQTSEVEGMAMSVVEAMQHGLLCVVTNAGEIKNYAKHKKNAIIIREPFSEHLSEAVSCIKSTVSNLEEYNKIAEEAFNTFKEKENFPVSLINNIKYNQS